MNQLLRSLGRIVRTPVIVCAVCALCAAAWADARTPRQRNVRGFRLDADAPADGFHESGHDVPVQCVYLTALVLGFTQAETSRPPSPRWDIASSPVAEAGPVLDPILAIEPRKIVASSSPIGAPFLGRAPPFRRL